MLEWDGPVVMTTTKVQDLLDMAEWLCEASGMNADPRARARVLQAHKLIEPLLLAAHRSGGGTADRVRWIYEGRAATEEVPATLTPPPSTRPWSGRTLPDRRPCPRPIWRTPAASTPPPGPSTTRASGRIRPGGRLRPR